MLKAEDLPLEIGKMDWIVTMDNLLCQKKEKKEINEKK